MNHVSLCEKSNIILSVLVKCSLIMHNAIWGGIIIPPIIILNKFKRIIFAWLECSIDENGKKIPCRQDVFIYVARIFPQKKKSFTIMKFTCSLGSYII